MRSALSSIGLAACFFVGGCQRTVEFERQTITIRHDPEADTVDVRLVHRGVFTPLPAAMTEDDQELLNDAVAAIERIASGMREFMTADGSALISIDEMAAKDAEEVDGTSIADPLCALRLEIYPLVHLIDHAAFVDDELRLGFVQHFEIRPWSEFERRTNELIGRAVITHDEAIRAGTSQRSGSSDVEGDALRVAKARAGTPWFAIRDGQWQLDLAMSHAEYADWVRLVLDPHVAVASPGFASLVTEVLASSRRVAHDDEGLELDVGVAGEPIRLNIQNRMNEYDHRLCEAVRAHGIELRNAAELADLLGDE
ncbi:MAG: hypothetical protein IPH13_01435 [Planctomycetes bacterium]|nr:hypothetical protein [Planctomycetota bacterium]MCC7171956.1 hypothetical protein [Planctomycetota bacterium]